MSLTEGVFQPLFANVSVVLLLIVPLLTMRLLSEERKLGTAELLFTYPISDWDAVLGKYFATVTVIWTMIALTFLFPLLLQTHAPLEWGPLVAGYAGLLLLGAAYAAIGLFFSSLSENQVVAGVLTFGFSLLALIIGWIQPFVTAAAGRVVSEISILEHLDRFAKGVIDTNDIVYYVNLSAIFLFLCSRVLESNRWRS
jgi:ABC-2 type transport system permease protein